MGVFSFSLSPSGSTLEERLSSHGICVLGKNAIKSRVPHSLQAEHFASGQTPRTGSFHLLYSSELQSSHSAPSLALTLQGNPVLLQQSRALTFLFSEGHGGHLAPANTSPTSLDDSLGDRAARSSRTSSDTNLLFCECQVVAIPKGFLEVER